MTTTEPELDPVNRTGGRFHAATIPPGGGDEQCLGCGEPWPCPDAPRTVSVSDLAAPPDAADVVATATAAQLPWPIVADQLGVDRAEVQDLLDAQPGGE